MEATTTTSSTTSTTIVRTTTTEPAPITVPDPEIAGDLGSAESSSALLLGIGGLSGAALLGTAPWRKLLAKRRRNEQA
ncbi:MAG: hypothetical protein EB037_09315 [Actinobacteria bacterium]|nr:hypothetical protein [Actinomycetota bacterium]